jgi:hypothetical protein
LNLGQHLKDYVVNSENRITNRSLSNAHHNLPINIPTAEAQAFLMDYPQGERAIAHDVGLVRIARSNDCKYSQDQRLNGIPKHEGARNNKILVTHPMTNQLCLASTIVHRAH